MGVVGLVQDLGGIVLDEIKNLQFQGGRAGSRRAGDGLVARRGWMGGLVVGGGGQAGDGQVGGYQICMLAAIHDNPHVARAST